MIGRSKHRDEYVRLMEAGWSSLAIERYAAYRYGEEIPASTVRTYRAKHQIQAVTSVMARDVVDPEQAVDVLRVRAELIQLQQQRIAIDWKHEQSMSKLFGSTKGEIAALSALLDAHKKDLQDVGVMAKAGDEITVHSDRPEPTPENGAVKARTLGELVGLGQDPAAEMELARVLHMRSKRSSGEQAG